MSGVCGLFYIVACGGAVFAGRSAVMSFSENVGHGVFLSLCDVVNEGHCTYMPIPVQGACFQAIDHLCVASMVV